MSATEVKLFGKWSYDDVEVTDISLVAEGAWDKFFAIGCVIALVGYQANNERLNK